MNQCICSMEDAIYLRSQSKHKIKDSQITAELLLSLAMDASAGVWHLHSLGIVHNDIACRNFLMDSTQQGFVCDFGLSVVLGEGNGLDDDSPQVSAAKIDPSVMLPFRWVAPEVLKDRLCSYASDVYMFGMFLWELFGRVTPYHDQDLSGMLKIVQFAAGIKAGTRRPTIPDFWPHRLKSLIADCLEHDASKRPNIKQGTD